MITLYRRGTDIVRANIEPNSSSEQRKQIMGEDTVLLNFSVPEKIDIQIGDYANIFGEKYTVNKLPTAQKIAKRNFSYAITLESAFYDLGKVNFLLLDADNNFTEGVFILKGKAEDFLNLIVSNMLRVFPLVDWQAGYCVDTDFKTLSFSAENCQAVLARLATEFDTEYLVEETTINLAKRQPASGLTLEYDAGLKSITRQNKDNSNVITRLYAYGSNKNLGTEYRGGAKRLRLPTLERYIEKNVNKYGVVEETRIFEDIYPTREGTITSVTDPFIFTDSSMDFDINDYLLPGVEAKVVFNTGKLAGYTFKISDYDNGSKTFTILHNTDEQTIEIPSVSLSPEIGDKYVLVDMLMPEKYIRVAENKLKQAAITALNDISIPQLGYILICDPVYFKLHNIELKRGSTIVVNSEEWELDGPIRCIGYSRNLRAPSIYATEVSDVVQEKSIVKLVKTI